LERNPLVICDTGHNAHGLQHSLKQLAKTPHHRLHIVFGVVADKDLSSILPLLPREALYYFTQADLPRALDAHQLAAQCTAAGLCGDTVPNVQEALSLAKSRATNDDVIFVGGSNFIVAEVI
jgi:dihydrofolate synthase/folylpolyglutamate synthase